MLVIRIPLYDAHAASDYLFSCSTFCVPTEFSMVMDIDTVKWDCPLCTVWFPVYIGSLVCCVLAHLCHKLKVSYCDHRMSVIRPFDVCH